MRGIRRFATLAVAWLVLLAPACGRDDAKTAPSPTSAGSGSTATAGAASGLGAGDFGSLKKVCGPRPSGMRLGATDTGVTAGSIQVSTFADPGFSGRPGLDQEFFDTATAFTKWCNSLGGINGRKIDVRLRDSKLSEFQQRVIEACSDGDFMMVGGGSVFDDTGQAERLACGLPTIAGYVVTPTAAGADLTVQPIPNRNDENSAGEFVYLRKRYPEAAGAVGVLTATLATTQMQARRYQEVLDAKEFTTVYHGTYNALGEATWRPFAEAMKTAGVKGLVWVGEPVNLAKLLQAVSDIGYRFTWVRADVNHYDPLLIAEGGAAVDGTYVPSLVHPFFDPALAAKNPATRDYRALMARYNPSGKIAYLGVQGLSSWLLFADAVKACGARVTRDCVYAKAKDHGDWTGGGLQAPANVRENATIECNAVLEVRAGKFVLTDIGANQGIYRCAPENVVNLAGDYGTGARCPNPAYATDPKPSNCAKS
ncbi:MAG: ABC transporter substrate-binding protein [Acidimicrobiia bacterium]